jgi:hypothetical protein
MGTWVTESLTVTERQLLDDARRGVFCRVSDYTPEDLAGRIAPGDRIRGEFVRELLLGRHGELDPRGVRLRGARIAGELDLDDVHTTIGLILICCYVESDVQMRDAQLPILVLRRTTIPTLLGDGLRVDGTRPPGSGIRRHRGRHRRRRGAQRCAYRRLARVERCAVDQPVRCRVAGERHPH